MTCVGEDVEKLEAYTLLVGMQNGAAAVENRPAPPEKVAQGVTTGPSGSTRRRTQKTSKPFLKQKLVIDVHNGIIHYSQKGETA